MRLERGAVDGYPTLDDPEFGYFNGTMMMHVDKNESLPLRVRTISAESAMDQNVGIDTLKQQAFIHAVGIGGMISKQSVKCKLLKDVGLWGRN